MPKIVNKSHSPHVLKKTPTEKEDLKRVLVKYWPKAFRKLS